MFFGLILIYQARGFNGSVNIPESCDFRSQFDLLNIICKPFSFYTFFVGICILNENELNKQIRKIKDAVDKILSNR